MDYKQFCNYVWGMYGNNTISRAWELYKKSQHALWMARAERANEKAKFIWVRNELWQAFPPKKPMVQFNKWQWVEHKCLDKAKEFE